MGSLHHNEWAYLYSYLGHLSEILDRADVSDIYVNRPGEVWIETLGGSIQRREMPKLDAPTIARLARQIAAFSDQGISREHPILSAKLPDGARVQIVMPPATRGDLAIAIRKHVSADMSLDEFEASGAFSEAKVGKSAGRPKADDEILEHLAGGRMSDALRTAVRGRRNILVSGGTSTGKTTFLNALVREIPLSERLITIEDTPELRIPHENQIGLIAARSDLSEARVTAEDLLNASLRMRPDRIILGELRGPEAYTFLRAINTGHPGSMTTVHADSPGGAVEQIALLVLQGGMTLQKSDIRDYIHHSIALFVQLGRNGARRTVNEVVCSHEAF